MAKQAQVAEWQLEGNSAEAYESFLVPAIFRQGALQLVEFADIQPGERVLDVGTGTGVVARTAAAAVGPSGSVVGVDPNPAMLQVARSAAAREGVDVDWQEGSAEELPLARSSFDAVLCQQVLQFVGDRARALREMHRILVPGGRLALSVLRSTEHNYTYQPLIDAFARHGSQDLGDMMQSPFRGGSREELRTMVLDAGFTSVSVAIAVITARFPSVADYLQQELASSPMSAVAATFGNDVREAITRDVSDALAAYIDDFGVVHPLQTYIVVATR